MPTKVDWDNSEQNRVLIELLAPMTWDEFHKGVQQAHKLIAAIKDPVDLIIWAKASLPPGFALPQFRSAFQAQPHNTRQIIVIPEEKPVMMMFFKQLASVIHKTIPQKSRVVFANTLEEARQITPLGKK